MPKTVARLIAAAALVLSAAACGYDTSATFNADGSVVVGLKFLFPKDVMQGTSGASVSGFSPADIARANQSLQAKYPGGKVTVVTEGNESGALITIPFKTEKEAFSFLTSPSGLSPSASTGSPSINLANTGGMFKAASHTSNGGTDTYTFQTQPAQMTSPSPGGDVTLTQDEIASIFTITFAITVPHVITSAPGALFTLDRKTAIWKLDWTRSETLTATTGSDAGLVASVTPGGAQDPRLLVAVGFMAIAAGFLIGMFMTWRGLLRRPQPAPVGLPTDVPPGEPPPALPGPPPGTPPPLA